MGMGLLVTFLAALVLSSSPVAMATIFGSSLKWVVIFAPLVLVFIIGSKVDTYKINTLRILFYVFAVLQGLALSTIFIVYTNASILGCLFTCAALFAAMSVYGYVTKRNLESFGQYLFMALIGVIIAMIVNLFLQSGIMAMIISIVGVFLFLALTAYDTQQIKTILWENPDTDRAVIMGSLTLYLDFLNLFMFILQIFGVKNPVDD